MPRRDRFGSSGALAILVAVAGCAGPSTSPGLATPTGRPSLAPTPVTATTEPTPTAQPSPESLVYPVAPGEAWILFDAPAGDPGEPEAHDALFLVRPDGTGLHRLVREMTGSEVRATWSPDGSQVAYIQTRWPRDFGPDAGIYVVNADGSDAHRIFECGSTCIHDYLDWGVDGAIYVGVASNFADSDKPPLTFEIWRIDPVSGDARAVLTREDEMTVEEPRLSPDGTRLVYTRERIADGKWAIFVADMAGGKEQQLTDWDLFASYPDWSAAGRISFNTYDLRLHNEQPHWIHTIAPDGTDLRRISTHDPAAPEVEVEAAHARWTADGSGMTYSILLDGEAYLGLMNGDGSDQQLIPGPVWGTFSELRPVR